MRGSVALKDGSAFPSLVDPGDLEAAFTGLVEPLREESKVEEPDQTMEFFEKRTNAEVRP